MKMREASEREANGAEKTEKKTERERAFNLSRISFIQLHELHFFA